jgi:hypothetical protein
MTVRDLLVVLFMATLLLACPGSDDDDSASGPPIPDFVDVEVRLSDVVTTDLLVGAEVTYDDQLVETDVNGRARLTIPSQDPFTVGVAMGAYADHDLAGLGGVDDIQYPARLIDRNTLGAWLVELNLAPDTSKGTLVVLLQTIALQAAADASVTIDAASDPPFVLVDGDPQAGDELVFAADSMVIFPNVDPGPVNLSISAPEGDSCLAFEALVASGDLTTFDVTADVITIAPYICQ